MTRPRKPTAVLEQGGAFVKDPQRKRARQNEPKPSGPIGDPPDHLDREEIQAWQYLASILLPGIRCFIFNEDVHQF
jgi:hypothetical protein